MSAKGNNRKQRDARPDVKWFVRVGGDGAETHTVTAARIVHHMDHWTSLVNAAGDVIFESPAIIYVARVAEPEPAPEPHDDDPRKRGTAAASRPS